MNRYNPTKTPDAAEWLGMGELERIALVEEHHRRNRVSMPSVRAHAAFHAIVENQIALGGTVVVETLARLREEGLGRHDAVHAIGSVLARLVHGVLTGTGQSMDAQVNEEYHDRLRVLTAQSWRMGG